MIWIVIVGFIAIVVALVAIARAIASLEEAQRAEQRRQAAFEEALINQLRRLEALGEAFRPWRSREASLRPEESDQA